MINSRHFSRIVRTCQLTCSYTTVNHKGVFNFQENLSYHRASYISLKSLHQCPMDWKKKRKTATPVWRPISTQSSSQQENLELNVSANPGNVANMEGTSTILASSPLQSQEEQLGNAEGILADSMTTASREVGEFEAVSLVSEDKHAVSFEVGASVMRFIKGKDGSVQKGLEEDMEVKLIFPSSKEDDCIVIQGESLDIITRASEKIQAIIDEAVRGPSYQYTHFVSLPLAIHPELIDKLLRFRSTILGDDDSKEENVSMDDMSSEEDDDKTKQSEKAPDVAVKLKVEDLTNRVKVAIDIPPVTYVPKTAKSLSLSDMGIDKSIFIKPERFHLTVLMLKLWNKERVRAATEVLQNVSAKVIEVLDNRPVVVRLKGLDCMRGNKAKAHVLYAPVEEVGNEERLLRACQTITDAFVEAGLVLEKDIGQKLKLHATIINTTHRKMRNRKGKKRSQPFDARGIFEQFGAEEWGEYHIREAHLSQRFFYDENGYYHCCTSIPFPENASTS